MGKLLTIVIPTYNMEAYLDRCLTSLIIADEQMEVLEVLVVNDGSKDRSSEIAHGYEAKYPQTFRVIDKENGNYGSCVNRGLAEARGKYIKILDADDWFDTANFEEFVLHLRTIDVDLIMCDTYKVDENGAVLEQFVYSFPKSKILTFETLMDCPFAKTMHSVAYRTENLRGIGYRQSEGISYTDTEWIFLPMTTCQTVYYYPKVVYYYLVGRNGQTMNPETYRKNFGQDIKVEMVMAETMKRVSSMVSPSMDKYLTDLLLSHAMFIYCHYFIDFRMNICYKEMVRLDKLLLDVSPIVCAELEKLYRLEPFNYHFVKSWRKRGYPKSLWELKYGLLLGDLKHRFLTRHDA